MNDSTDSFVKVLDGQNIKKKQKPIDRTLDNHDLGQGACSSNKTLKIQAFLHLKPL